MVASWNQQTFLTAHSSQKFGSIWEDAKECLFSYWMKPPGNIMQMPKLLVRGLYYLIRPLTWIKKSTLIIWPSCKPPMRVGFFVFHLLVGYCFPAITFFLVCLFIHSLWNDFFFTGLLCDSFQCKWSQIRISLNRIKNKMEILNNRHWK